MAEGFPDYKYTVCCSECDHEFELSILDLYDYEELINDYLIETEDMYGMYELRSELDTIMEVPITVQCGVCDADIEMDVLIDAKPVWSEDDLKRDRDPKCDGFDITFLGGQLNENLTISGFEHLDAIRDINLLIICKTRMNKGFCYIGYDEVNKRLLRPIFRTSTGQCCWPGSRHFEINNSYTFKVLHHPDIPAMGDPPTPLPHRHDDLLVSEEISLFSSEDSFSPNLLECIAKPHVSDLFPDDLVKERKFVYKDANCPSVGLLLTSEKNVRMHMNKSKKIRVSLPGGYDIPWTGLGFDQPKIDGERKALVLLGLGRPWFGQFKNFHTARCYILVLNVFLY